MCRGLIFAMISAGTVSGMWGAKVLGQGSAVPQIKQDMQEIYQAVEQLNPVMANPQEVRDPKNHKVVLSSLSKIEQKADSVESHGGKTDHRFVLGAHMLRTMAEQSKEHYQAKRFDAASSQVRKMAHTCFDCHSRTPGAKADDSFAKLSEKLLASEVTTTERARLLMATRQFEKADKLYQKILSEQNFKWYEFSHNSPLLDYMILKIRVVPDFPGLNKQLAIIAQSMELPLYLSEYLKAWQKSLVRIQKDKSLQEISLAAAKANLQAGNEVGSYHLDRTVLVHYLQASRILGQLLATKKLTAGERSEAYYLMGVSEVMTGRRFWLSQAASYLEAAIRTSPQSESARKAYRMLEEHIIIYAFSVQPEFLKTSQFAKKLQELKKTMAVKS